MSILGGAAEKLERHLSEGTNELRNFLGSTLYGGGSKSELDRITKYHLYWNFYEGNHYKDHNESMLSLNYVRAFINKVNAFLVGDTSFTFKVQSFSNDIVEESLEKNVEKLLLRNWRLNKMDLLIHEILQMGSICGDAWVGLRWDSDMEFCQINLYDSRQCFPEFENGDINKLSSFTIRQQLTTNSNSKAVVRVIKYTKTTMEIWTQTTSAAEVSEKDKTRIGTVVQHNLGFIPVVHFKNKPQSYGYYSVSDAEDIVKLNKIYNELNQEIKSIIDYYATPTTVVTGANIKTLKRGIGNIWSGLPPEANVFNLGLDVDLSATTQFLQNLKTAMHEISDVPENVLGKIQAISGTSAAALKLTYQPLVQQAELKALTYGEGIAEINSMILRFYEKYNAKNETFTKIGVSFRKEFKVVPVFSFGFPTDKMVQLQEAQMELGLNIGSKKEIMNRMGKNNVPDLLQQIEQERRDEAQLQAENQTILQTMMQESLNTPTLPEPPKTEPSKK